MTEQEVITGLRNKDDKALEYVFLTYWKKVGGTLIKNKCDKQRAKDIYLDAVLAFRDRVVKDDTFECENIGSYLISTALRNWMKELGDDTMEIDSELPQESELDGNNQSDSEAELLEKEKNIEKVRKGIQELKDPYRELLTKLYLDFPPTILRNIKILKKDSTSEYRNFEDLKKIRFRGLKLLRELLKNK